MTTQEAVEHVLKTTGMTKYALAKSIHVTPTSITQYLKGTRMSEKPAMRFTIMYGVEISDVYLWE